MPVYNLATREDHIAPAKSVLYGSRFFGGPVKFVLAGSGHIAGVINPPGKPKYQYWTGAEPGGTEVDKWLESAQEHPGSWWPDWLEWLKAQDATTVPARAVGNGKLKSHRGRAGLVCQSEKLDLTIESKGRDRPGAFAFARPPARDAPPHNPKRGTTRP